MPHTPVKDPRKGRRIQDFEFPRQINRAEAHPFLAGLVLLIRVGTQSPIQHPEAPNLNPRARVGRDRIQGAELCGDEVSIRAPAWGATPRFLGPRQHFSMFQSARPRGARPTTQSRRCRTTSFQSARPRGARLMPSRYCSLIWVVSIRAPAWGATLFNSLSP